MRCRVGSTPIPFRHFSRRRMIIAGHSFPDELWLLIEHQVWARPVDAQDVVVGITALGIHLAGDIHMCRLKPVGTEVVQGRGLGVVELAKTIVSVKAAVSGLVVEVNHAVELTPALIRSDLYGEGWLARIRCGNLAANLAALQQPANAIAATEQYIAASRHTEGWTDG